MDKNIDYYLSLNYRVEIEKIPHDLGGGFMACIPLLGRYAILGDGETMQEAYDQMRACQREIITDWLEQGLWVPEPEALTAS